MTDIVKQFEGQDINIQQDGDDLWFRASDVAARLGYEDTDQAIRDHVDSIDRSKRRVNTSSRNRWGIYTKEVEVTYINESGLYCLIMGSTKPEAKRFKHWVTSVVLPEIRKTGGYGEEKGFIKVIGGLVDNMTSLMKQVLTELRESRAARENRDYSIPQPSSEARRPIYSTYDPDASWGRKPASKKQRYFLDVRRVKYTTTLTRGEAFKLIRDILTQG
jgi:prophage antirepressor-like protein